MCETESCGVVGVTVSTVWRDLQKIKQKQHAAGCEFWLKIHKQKSLCRQLNLSHCPCSHLQIFSAQLYIIWSKRKCDIDVLVCGEQAFYEWLHTRWWCVCGVGARAGELPPKVIKHFYGYAFLLLWSKVAGISLCPYRMFAVQYILWLLLTNSYVPFFALKSRKKTF